MNEPLIFIRKSSGELEHFSFHKLKKSLQKSGASSKDVNLIIKTITPQLYDGITTKEIYKKAFRLLKKSNRIYASKYSLKRAIFDLGPTGYPFERLVGAILKQKGYKTQVSVQLQGECVTHEIDVLAEKEGNTFTIECKFHSNIKTVSNVKIPLYINSRFLDVQKKWNTNPNKATFLKQGWLVTNTRFTEDAINYGKCVELILLSWNYPKGNGISKNIDAFGLYPITTLTTLTKKEKKRLIESDIILTQELAFASHKLKQLKFPATKIEKIISEAKKLCNSNSF
ncbi:MAG: restriction endonuclease [Flavobacteriaceae bacterium]|nr:restriction endonuclease [Flavobacteriaceae bacterium]